MKINFSELLQVAASVACPSSRSHDGLAPEDRRGRASSPGSCSAAAAAAARFAAAAADAAGAAAGGHAGVAIGPASAASAASAGRAAYRARWEALADESAAIAGTGLRVKD